MNFLTLVLCFHVMTAVICSSKETPPDEPDTPQPNGIIDDGQNDNRSDGPRDQENRGSSSSSSNSESSGNDSTKNSESPGESKQDDEDGEEGGRSRDLSEEESEDDDDDGDNRLPQPDINTGQNEGNNLIPDITGILPGNWGANCPQLAEQNMCNNNLYRTLMQRSCKTSCGAQNCLDRRSDLCEAWEKRGFCTSEFYKDSRNACERTCKICQS